ncbi:MAG: pilus assembly protein [Candidatus Sphingomonas phytovorans]|nr:TadE/TadG family type IV pilus assembly protein [Sphingomonas sp.]WEK01083.1 MAG: pilus assembly protein [Sphingomonas sp.]
MHLISRIAGIRRISRLHGLIARLRRDRGGLAMLEFGLAMPVVLALGLYGVETANLALINLRVSQIALNLADNAGRVGTTSALNTQQLREVDINDILQAVRYQGSGIGLGTKARITLSSLENVQQSYDTAPVQRIHWQRCFGMKSGTNYDSSYGTTATAAGTTATSTNAGTTAATGMGDTNAKVNAPAGSGVMFVEINYYYTPLSGTWLMSPARIHYVASFIVRDNRDFSQIFNPTPAATRATCNLYAS